MNAKLTVWAPATPGMAPSVVGEADTKAEAMKIAEKYENRNDLRAQDVFIRLGKDGKIIAGNLGPCR